MCQRARHPSTRDELSVPKPALSASLIPIELERWDTIRFRVDCSAPFPHNLENGRRATEVAAIVSDTWVRRPPWRTLSGGVCAELRPPRPVRETTRDMSLGLGALVSE
jgi:hypothetical protein